MFVALSTLALSLGLEHDYYAILLQIWLQFVMIVLSIRYMFVADSAIWVFSASSFGLFSLALTMASRRATFQPVVNGFIVEGRTLLDAAHFIHGIALLCFAKAAVVSQRWKLNLIQEEQNEREYQLKKRR